MSDVYTQFEQQRELARMQRRHHDAETALDKAEVRHNALVNWIMGARFFVPLGIILFVGGIGPNPGATFAASLIAYIVSTRLALAIAQFWDGIVGKFRDDVLVKTQHFWITTFGILTAFIGPAVGPGLVLTGIIQAVTPFIWLRWARHVYRNTDYSRMKAEAQIPPAAPRLYE